MSTDVIAGAVQALQPYMTEALGGLVAAASPSGGETPAAVVAEELLSALGLASERIALRAELLEHLPLYSPACCADGGRYNLLAIHEGNGGPSVLFNGHLDVVPTAAGRMWRHPPYAPVVEDGWLHGRGAGDMKGGIVWRWRPSRHCARSGCATGRQRRLQLGARRGMHRQRHAGLDCLRCVPISRAGSASTTFDAVIIPEPLGEGLITAQIGGVLDAHHAQRPPCARRPHGMAQGTRSPRRSRVMANCSRLRPNGTNRAAPPGFRGLCASDQLQRRAHRRR